MLGIMEIKRPESKQPMPADAKKVFEGKLFDVYQWEQELFDGSKTIFERIKRADTVVTFPVLSDGRILLLKQQQPTSGVYLSGAGGRMDEGEDPLWSAKRELLEETGYEASEWVLWDAEQPVGKIDWAVYVFVAKGLTKVAEPNLDAGEKIESNPVLFEEFLAMATNPLFSEREIVPKLLEARCDETKMQELKALFANLGQ
jgi:ADP-ribose pyrophosphatase